MSFSCSIATIDAWFFFHFHGSILHKKTRLVQIFRLRSERQNIHRHRSYHTLCIFWGNHLRDLKYFSFRTCPYFLKRGFLTDFHNFPLAIEHERTFPLMVYVTEASSLPTAEKLSRDIFSSNKHNGNASPKCALIHNSCLYSVYFAGKPACNLQKLSFYVRPIFSRSAIWCQSAAN